MEQVAESNLKMVTLNPGCDYLITAFQDWESAGLSLISTARLAKSL
jgi:hypothetical protein